MVISIKTTRSQSLRRDKFNKKLTCWNFVKLSMLNCVVNASFVRELTEMLLLLVEAWRIAVMQDNDGTEINNDDRWLCCWWWAEWRAASDTMRRSCMMNCCGSTMCEWKNVGGVWWWDTPERTTRGWCCDFLFACGKLTDFVESSVKVFFHFSPIIYPMSFANTTSWTTCP